MALACNPDIVVMDEPTTGLDVTTQSRLLIEIKQLSQRSDTAIVYVTHDLGVIRNIADRVMVMYAGRIVEEAPVDELFREPRHPYTRRLLEAIPRLEGPTILPRGIAGTAAEPWNRPSGCPFAPRCDLVVDRCRTAVPPLEAVDGRLVRCIRWSEASSPPSLAPAPAAEHEDRGRVGDILVVDGVAAVYGRRRWRRAGHETIAVEAASFAVPRGYCVGLVGESGSGKSTLLRTIAGLHSPATGRIVLDGLELAPRARRRSADSRRRIQLVPQNPDASLNPRHSIRHIVGRPLRQFHGLRGEEQRRHVIEMLERVRLTAAFADRMPTELSGGERQRVAIARALAAGPDLLLCDEITSALDVAVQAGILALLDQLRLEFGLSIVFVSHDLAVVRAIADLVVMMRHGRIREAGTREQLFAKPQDDYTRELLAAVPRFRDGDYPDERVARLGAASMQQ
jgi:peptide/nickel transport system ATP-binding protein